MLVQCGGRACVLAWLLGALCWHFLDGSVWAELGAKWPEAGGSYVFLQKIYRQQVWQNDVVPAGLANHYTGAPGSCQRGYRVLKIPRLFGAFNCRSAKNGKRRFGDPWLPLLLYRNIKSIGKISVLLWIITGGTFLWLIGSGFRHFNPSWAFSYSKDAFDLTPIFFVGLGQASLKTVYSYLGYYNVCHLGSEIKNPEINIPRSIFISVAGIAVLYLGMQIMLLGALPWKTIAASPFVISTYFQQIYSPLAGKIATVLVLTIAASSLFALMLGYSRIPYAAARRWQFFQNIRQSASHKKVPLCFAACF